MQYITLVLSIFFFTGMGYNLYENDAPDAILQFFIGAVLFMYTLVFIRDRNMKRRWAELLVHQNAQDLIEAASNDFYIQEDSELVQYEVCLSLGVLTFRRQTAYYIKDYHFTPLLNLMFTAFTFVFGWWGLPWGPVHTIGTIKHNLFARSKSLQTVIEDENPQNIKQGA